MAVSSNIIGEQGKPEKLPFLSVPAVQHAYTSAFLPHHDGSYCNKPSVFTDCHNSLKFKGTVLLVHVGNCCVVRLAEIPC